MRRNRILKQEKIRPTVNVLLDSYFWIPELVPMQVYTRLHDDHEGTGEGELNVLISPDGDCRIWITGLEDKIQQALRFRTYEGGGLSLRTRNALVLLAEAIRLDNLEQQQKP